MKHLRFTFYACGLLLIALAACAPQATPTGQPSGNNSSSSSGGSSESSVTPVNLAGPEMKVGSTWLYADGSVLVAVPAGPFTMGQGGVDNPVHQVTLSDFWIYRDKVTNAQYAFCASQNGCTPPDLRNNKGYTDSTKSQDPVVGVTYDQAAAYCSFVHGQLPTEAEWEKTARGPDANIYPWGNSAPGCDLLNFDNCKGGTTQVNLYPQGQSYYTAFDMEGNTFEWVADWYRDNYYSASPVNDPSGPDHGQQRSVRSSGFDSGHNQTPAATRFFTRPEDDRANLGFRCVVLDPTYFAPFCNYPATYGTDGVGGGPNGQQTTVDCPNLNIQQTTGCVENSPSTIVTFNGPSGSTITAPPPPGCKATGNPDQYRCITDGALSICSSCTVTITSDPQCPAGYEFDSTGKNCVAQPAGSGQQGQCLPGFTVVSIRSDQTGNTVGPTQQSGECCMVNPQQPPGSTEGTGGGQTCGYIPGTHIIKCQTTVSPCPAGTYFDGTECIATQVIYPYCNTAGVDLHGDSAPGSTGCQPPPGGCGLYSTWDPSTCSCSCTSC